MSTQNDVEALLSAVRALVASRPEPVDPLLLTAEQRVDAAAHRCSVPGADSAGVPVSDALLRDFARLTLIAAADETAQAGEEREMRHNKGDTEPPAAPVSGAPGLDPATLRALVGELLHDELREGVARQLSDDLFQRLREELDRRLGPDPTG